MAHNTEPENHVCEKEHHLPNLHFWFQNASFGRIFFSGAAAFSRGMRSLSCLSQSHPRLNHAFPRDEP